MEPHWLIIIQLLVLPGLVVLGALCYSTLVCRPRIDDSPAADLLILAAHPDDCAIIAGEYAQVVAAAGRSIQIVYLTDGAAPSEPDRAAIRRRECIDAWSLIGVPESNLIFLGFPHTDPAMESVFTDAMLKQSQDRLAEIFRALPERTRIILPAQGETHIDHRNLRHAALHAFRNVARQDLETLEAPEYNPYFSLARAPARSLIYVVASIPGISRLIDRRRFIPPPNFFEGPSGMILPPDSERLAVKCRMLRKFTTENPDDILVKHFGFPDHYRRFDPIASIDAVPGRWYLRIGERYLSPGIIAWWLSLWCAVLVLLYVAGRRKVRLLGAGGLFGSSTWAVAITALVGIALLAFALIRRNSVERRVTFFVSGAGLLAGGLAAEEVLFDAIESPTIED